MVSGGGLEGGAGASPLADLAEAMRRSPWLLRANKISWCGLTASPPNHTKKDLLHSIFTISKRGQAAGFAALNSAKTGERDSTP